MRIAELAKTEKKLIFSGDFELRDVNSRGMMSARIVRAPRALFNECLDIQNRYVIMELRPLKDEVISRISIEFDGLESILSGFLLKSVHFSLTARFFETFPIS